MFKLTRSVDQSGAMYSNGPCIVGTYETRQEAIDAMQEELEWFRSTGKAIGEGVYAIEETDAA